MKPCSFRIWTDDLAASRAFYTETLPFHVKVDGFDRGWIIVGTPTIDLILELDDGAESSRYTGLSFWVDDIHATHRYLSEKGVHFVLEPQQQEWGGWLVDFKDCTGNTLTLVQNAD